MKTLFIYSEEGCPWCSKIKEELTKSGIRYLVRDIERYEKEWKRISEEAKTEYIPTVCIVDHTEKTKTYLVPDTDFEEIDEAIEKVKILMS
jgi:glutaredoxin